MSLDEDITTELARATQLEAPASPTWIVHVVAGAQIGQAFRLEGLSTRRAMVGQSPVCEVKLDDRSVSRRHVALESDGRGLRVIDLGSRNGTWVDTTRVRDASLRNGDVVRLGDAQLRLECDELAKPVAVPNDVRFHRVIGASPQMRAMYPLFRRVGESELPVLIEGETGTGKEVLAESLHEASPRRHGPFVVFDCTTVAATLLESELFGHEKGSFTGADNARSGLFEAADGGTLFVDEIGELEASLQAKLLRAIERHEVRRVGSNKMTTVNVRVIAATRRDLDKDVQARRFRDDLFYRLAVARLELPPLRRRVGDVSFLARYFWTTLGGDARELSPDVIQRFEEYDWPGNVRELHFAVTRQLALGDAGDLPLNELGPTQNDYIDAVVRSRSPLPRARQQVVAELERRYVEHMLALHDGNVTRAAEASGVGRRYFQIVRAKKKE